MIFKNFSFKLLTLLMLYPGIAAMSQPNTKGVKVITSNQSTYTNTKAVIIGISNYMNIRSLNYAHSDALNFYSFLVSDAGGNVDSNNIVLLLNDKATSANIYGSLDWLVDEAKEGERIIIYFSGHGDLETKTIRQNGFLLGYDSPEHCYMAGGTVSVGFLQDYLETIAQQCKSNILLITDACRSGKLAGGETGAQNTSAALAQNWQSITKVLSSQAGEYSLEADSWGNGAGVFTHYLVNGLTGKADRNKNKEVSTQELYMYLMENIGRETNYSQNPILVGDMTSTLAWVDSLSLTQLDVTTQIGSHELLASKGFESMYKEQLSTEAYAKYEKFRYCLENELLIPEYSENENAWDIYQSLLEDENAEIIHNHIKRSLLAALQNKSQIFVNLYITSQNIDDSLDIKRAISELYYAYDIINPDYILYNDIKARYLMFQSFEPDASQNGTILLEEATKIKPDAAYLQNQLGLKYVETNRSDTALTRYKAAINLTPSWPYPYNNIGNIYNDNEQYELAINHYEKAIELKSDYSNAYYNLGIVYRKIGKNNEAIDSYLKAVKLKPNNPDAYNNLGRIYNTTNDFNKALDAYLKAIDLKPNYSTAYNGIGNVYNNLEEYEKSIDSYLKAVELDSNYYHAYNGLGNAYNNIGQYDNAINSYLKAIQIKPDYTSAYSNLGYTYYDIGKYSYAMEAYLIAIDIEPNNYLSHYHIGIVYNNLRQYDNAIDSYLTSINKNQSFIDAYIRLGSLYNDLQQYDKAIELYLEVITVDPDNISITGNLAHCYREKKAYKEAITYFNQTIDLENDNISSYIGLGYCYLNLKDYNMALTSFKKTIELDPNDPWYYYNIACLYSLQKDIQEALTWFEKSLKMGLNNWEHIKNDPDINNIRNTEKYKELIDYYKSQN